MKIPPRATVERTAQFPFGRYYAVRAGVHAIGLRYDQRLMKAPEPGKEPWVPWGKSRFKLMVKK